MKMTAHEVLDARTSFHKDVTAAALTGSAVDTINCSEILVVVSTPTLLAGTTPTINIKVEESDTSAFTATRDVTGAVFTELDTVFGVDKTLVGRIEGHGTQRYLRAHVTGGGTITAASAFTAVTFILMGGYDMPVTQAETVEFNVRRDTPTTP